MAATLEFFSEARIALQNELRHHVDLQLELSPTGDFEQKLGEIAACLGIVLDGMYSPEDVDEICRRLTQKLYERREIVVVSSV